MKQQKLKSILEKLYRDYDFHGRIAKDPIEFPHRFGDARDIELAGFIAACFAYGKVELFKSVLERLFAIMGGSPYRFLADFEIKKIRKKIGNLKYRFNETEDIVCLLYVLSVVIKKHGSIEAVFKKYFDPLEPTIFKGLNGMVGSFLDIDTSAVYGGNIRPSGFLQFLPSPRNGSACKRMNLFLRWMIRDTDIDFGTWKGIPKDRLVIPLDTHIARISRCLGFTKRSGQDWKMAVEITEALKRFDAVDPIKYDFALCHQGISKACGAGKCGDCPFDAAGSGKQNQ
ncbi:MAG: TIGR02757 family protein [Nitrospirae bacterium]|nr:MAG: TIGR02757 family protein [Nitrospirota bacterium]